MSVEGKRINRIVYEYFALGFGSLALLLSIDVLVLPGDLLGDSEFLWTVPWIVAGPGMIARAYRQGQEDSKRSGAGADLTADSVV